jgi:hypothetical protein
MAEIPFRRTFTAAITEIASNLSLLRTWVSDDQPDLAASSVDQIQKLLLQVSEDFTPHRHAFAASGGPGEVLQLRHRFYASAHDAIIGEARSFMEILWFHIDAKGREETVAKALGKKECSPEERSKSLKVMAYSSGLHTEKVLGEWDRAKSGISELLTDEWMAAFRPLEARAFREFSHAKFVRSLSQAASTTQKPEQKKPGKSKRGRPPVSTRAADEKLVANWYSASNTGQRKSDFEKGWGLDSGAVTKAISRLRAAEYRKSRESIDAH